MNYIRTAYRIFFFALLTFIAALIAMIMKVLGAKHSSVFKAYNAWKKTLLWIMNIEVIEEGEPIKSPGILMANHRSYVDIVITPSQIPYVIVAKKSVKSWPIVGFGGTSISTIWVDRNSKESRHDTREQMRDRLEKGGSVLVFPEGTTDKGPGLLELKPGMFHVCAEGGFPIHPFAIEYENPDIAWVGDDLFIPHFVRHFGSKKVRVKVKYGPTISGTDGEQLRLETYNWLDQNLRQMRNEWANN